MRTDIAHTWADALESGEYEQGRRALAVSDPGPVPGVRHCCLGVLCELAIADGVALDKTPAFDGTPRITYAYQASTLPEEVQEWAGMQTNEGTLQTSGLYNLSGLNDDGVPFPEIAAIIRANVEAL